MISGVFDKCSASSFLVIHLLFLGLLLRELLLELLFVVDLLETAESGLGGSTPLTLHEVDPDKIGTLGFADLL